MPIKLSLRLLIIFLWALPQMSTDIYLPSLPAMAHYFNTNIATIQYTIFFYSVGFSFGALFFGPLSDRKGRRPIIIITLVLSAIGSLIALTATNLFVLFFARLLQGISLGGTGAIMRTVVRDICPDKNQMAKFGAILGVIMPLASSIAPILGGYIEEYLNWRWSFVFLFVYILGFLIYSYKNYQETNNNPLTSPFTSVFYDYLEIIRNKRFFCYNLTSAFAVCSVFSYLTVSSYLLQIVVKLTPEQFGYSNVLIALTLIGSSYLNGLLIHRKGIDKLLKRGTLFLATGGLLFFTAGVFNFINIYTVLIPLVIITLGCGFIYPNASAGGLSLFANNAGTASAVYACIQMIGASLGSGIISLLTHNFNHHMLFLGLIILCQGLIGSYLAKKLVSLKQQN